MSKASNAALAIGVGYLLGRKRKLRLAFVFAGAAATGKLGGVATQAIRRGGSLVGSSEAIGSLSPELGKVVGSVRGDLADAGKAAVQAAVASRINQLTDSLRERAEGLRDPLDADGAEEAEPGEPEDDDRGRDAGSAEAADRRPRSGRPDTRRPRRREQTGGDTDRPRRHHEPARRDQESGPRRRSAARSATGDESRSASADMRRR